MNPTDQRNPDDRFSSRDTDASDEKSLVPENRPRERELLRQIRMKLKSGFYGSRAILETIADRMMGK
ncbi:hypothetical protein IT157_06250 [bacterium]|nr:hypothetical protein [bacterium]